MVKKKRQNDPGEGSGSTDSEEYFYPLCPHIAKAIDLTKIKKSLKKGGFSKQCLHCMLNEESLSDSEDKDDGTLWMCLRCGSELCGRSKHKHAVNHFYTPHSDCHALVTNTTTWDVYCYACAAEIRPSRTKKLLETIEYLKKHAADGGRNFTGGDASPPPANQVIVLQAASPKTVEKAAILQPLRVRGLSNLGNTCFFNSVLQCLVQTPYLLPVLKEMAEPGEKFTLPGGKLKYEIKVDGVVEKKELDLLPITGELSEWGPLTRTLAETLEELQSPDRADVFTPRKLLSALTTKLPQFGGGDQHDAHELLRHLLEAVRSEDLRRYQAVILTSLGLSPKVDPTKVDGEIKQKVKFYGQQASDTMLRPEQVFRGFLVSTLECQDCLHRSDRHEYFLDLSLPVAAERPVPPAIRRKNNENESYHHKGGDDGTHPKNDINHLSKKEKRKEKRAKKQQNKNAAGSSSCKSSETSPSNEASPNLETKSSSEQSDADVEDNTGETTHGFTSIWGDYVAPDNNTQLRTSPIETEPSGSSSSKADDTPEDSQKDATLNNSSVAIALAYKPLPQPASNPDSGVASPAATQHNSTENVDRTESPGGSQEFRIQTALNDTSPKYDLSPVDNGEDMTDSRVSCGPSNEVVARGISVEGREFVKQNAKNSLDNISGDMKNLKLGRRVRPNPLAYPLRDTYEPKKDYLYSYEPLVSPRFQLEDGDCTVQSCLNQFTALELMTGNNKVGCEACTDRINGKNGKTVYTNATKRFLVSYPPSVLILHLKRFQLGPRCTFRKISKHVDFQTLLDLAPFCRGRSWASPGQNEIYYSLYGVVEHSGGMHGGHYVAYVKLRPPVPAGHERWNFIAKGGNVSPPENGDADSDSDTSISGYESGSSHATPIPPPGKWYYISDSQVSEVPEDRVLRAQAYLLFYERIQ